MENSVKALYIAAGMLLGVMILSVWVYIFRQGASIGQFYEADRKTEQIQAFNSQFDKYTAVTKENSISSENLFDEKGNLPSDVVTCASLAYNINRKNDFDEKNSVTVVVEDIPSSLGLSSGPYYIYSKESQPKGAFVNYANNEVDFNKFLKAFNQVKILYSRNSEVVYKYYFDVEADGLEYSEITGKINKITFICKEVKNFDDLKEQN